MDLCTTSFGMRNSQKQFRLAGLSCKVSVPSRTQYTSHDFLLGHDIFSPQPVRNAAVFLVRAITHDWSDEYCVKFLTQLRAAATPSTQLVVVDNVISYACLDSQETLNIPGVKEVRPTAPKPLLPNFGTASAMTYLLDVSVSTYELPPAATTDAHWNILYHSS